MTAPWTWKHGTPAERGRMVRAHAQLEPAELAELFDLTPAGVYFILAGADWSPEFQMHAPAVLDWEAVKAAARAA